MRGVPLTPEQRAQRAVARRALARRVALRSALGTAALVIVMLLLGYWLLTTIGGRDVLLAQIVSRLPAGTTLQWQRAEGPAAGPLTLHGVRFTQRPTDAPRGEPIVFTAQRIVLDPAIRPLLGRRLRLDALDIVGATLALPESDEPFELPRWPESLPMIAPPLSLQADTIRVDRLKVTRDAQPLIDIRTARGGVDAAQGFLHVEQLAIDSDRGRFTLHGDYVPREDYRVDLTGTAVLPVPAGRTPLRLGLVARGDLSRMDVAVSGNAPAPLRASVTLRGKDDPRWSARAKSDALDLALLLGEADSGTPLVFELQADGVGGRARLQGRVAQGELEAVIRPSRITLENQVLDVAPLVVDTFDGRITLRGHADLRQPAPGQPDTSNLRFAVNARGLTWGGQAQGNPDTPAIVADADFGIAGKPEAWAAIGTARFTRDGQRADLRFDGRGNGEQVAIRSLRATMPTGTLDATGNARWSPQLGWDLDATLAGFDPGYFLPAWPGAVNGRFATRGSARKGGGFDATLDVPQLRGRLRGRALDGRGDLELRGDDIRGDVALSLGNSRLEARGRIAGASANSVLDVDARFAPVHLDDLWPDAAGSLRGTLELTGARDAPNIDADLTGSGLRWGDYRADALQARGRLPWRGGNGALDIDAQGIDVGLAVDSLRIDARGAVESLQLDADARSELGTLALVGNASKRGNAWQGALASLQLAPVKGAQWRLQQPARFAWDGRNGALSNACLASSGGGALCANADWPRRGLDVDGSGLPLALLTPYLPERTDGRPWLLRGELALDAQVRPLGSSWRGSARVTSSGGGLKNSERARRELVSYAGLTLDATFDPQRIEARLTSALNDDGRIDARIATGWDGYAPLSGEVVLDTDELTWMELLSPDIVEPTGRLDGRIALGGSRAQPSLGGQAHLSGFTTELPALAITLRDGDVRMTAQSDGTSRISGSLRSGDGTLNLDGTLGWRGDDTPLVLNVRGSNVLASDTRDLRAVIDPDVTVRYAARQPLDITGIVGVPSASIDLERLDEGVTASDDVVVLDPVDPKRGLATPLDLDLTLALGDDVNLNGFGLDDAGVMQSRALGGSVFGVGKYLSPKLYVGYGVSLLGTGQVLTLKYLLRKGFDIEIESSTLENRASVNWRKEK